MKPTNALLAIDLGASSGRVLIGTVEQGKITLTEIHRFSNSQIKVFNRSYWNYLSIFSNIKSALTMIPSNTSISAIGVDTWGVDFALLDKNGAVLENPRTYRDDRTIGVPEKLFEIIPMKELYQKTGNQILRINTIFQLYSLKLHQSPLLSSADKLLFMPDLFHYLLSGEKYTEYTIASTSQLLNSETRQWNREILDRCGFDNDMFCHLIQPGRQVGELVPSLRKETGLGPIPVIIPPSHDTASAVSAIPRLTPNRAFLSSGTWSLLGVEIDKPIISPTSFEAGFTNEGTGDGNIRYLKNMMGLWLLQECVKKWKAKGWFKGYDHLLNEAKHSLAFRSLINPDHYSFINPENMLTAIDLFCKETGQPLPETMGEYSRCVLESLALKYKIIIDEINHATNKEIDGLHIVGGGVQNNLLNQFAANAVNLPVYAGPVEATALGNILTMARGIGLVGSLTEQRRIVNNSFKISEFLPKNPERWWETIENNKNILLLTH